MTATVAETVAASEIGISEGAAAVVSPDEVLLVPVPGLVEDKLSRLVRQTQAPRADVVASWLAAGDADAPVPAGDLGAVNVLLPGPVVAQVRAEAKRRGLQPGQVASARLASVASRGR